MIFYPSLPSNSTNRIYIKPPKNIKIAKPIFFSSSNDRRIGYIDRSLLKNKNFLKLKIDSVFCNKDIFIIPLKIAGS